VVYGAPVISKYAALKLEYYGTVLTVNQAESWAPRVRAHELRISDILQLLFSSMPLFLYPTSTLPKIPHVPLGIGGYSQQRHRQTDGQTDGRHAIARPRFALKCIAPFAR